MSLPDHESYRLHCIVRRSEDVYHHLRQLQALIRFQGKPFHLLVLLSGPVLESVEGALGGEDRRAMLSGEGQCGPGMVMVLVREQESGDGAWLNSEGRQPFFYFSAG